MASGTPTGYANAAVGGAKLAANNPSYLGLNKGQASSLGKFAGGAGDILGIYQGLNSHTGIGDASAAVNAAKLGSAAGILPSAVGTAAGSIAPFLGLYSGLKQGGVAGDAEAALSAYQAYGVLSPLFGGGAAAGAAGGAAAGGAAASTAAGGAAAGGAGSAGAGGAAIGAGAIAGTAAAAAIPIMALLSEFGVIKDDTLPSGAAFVKSIQGTPYFTQQQQQQMDQVYGKVGEAGFWSWFHQNFPGWKGSTGKSTASMRPT